jgi:3-hydroxyisobutyrate dehydrogenase
MSLIKVGFIGLGNMGMLMAKTLVQSQLPLTVYDLRPEAVAEMKLLGAAPAGSCREVAAASDVIVSMVRDIPETQEVIFGSQGIWQGIGEGSAIVISSTVSPAYCHQLYEKAKEKGVQVVDAAVSTASRNFTPGQESAVFTLMVGGDEDAVKNCMPVFEALTRNIIYLGGIGNGQACKLINNLASFGNAIFARECLNIGLKAGLDLNQMVEAMRLSTGYSRGLMTLARQIRQPRPIIKGAMNKPTKELGDKDRDFAIELAESAGANTPITRFMSGLNLETEYEELSKQQGGLNNGNQ